MAERREQPGTVFTARVGFIAGCCLALMIAVIALASRWWATAGSTPTAMLSPSVRPVRETPSIRPPTQIEAASPTATSQDLLGLELAERLLEEGRATEALELLLPLLEQLPEGEEAARLNFDLAMAEFQLGRFQRAAGYLEAAVAFGPTAERLYWLAVSYDTGGDYENALGYYLRLSQWQTEEAAEYRDFAIWRSQEIIDLIGTPTPSR